MSPSTDPVAFFKEKRPWSFQKDKILSEYVPSFLQKMSRYSKRPILIVDGFAGPGRFQSGEPGSPLIFAEVIKASRISPSPELIAVEPHPKLAELLATELAPELAPYDFATVEHSDFIAAVPGIRARAVGKTTFLYLDPFAIAGLDWAGVESILELIKQQHSVELLLNFNAHAFVRRARAALAMEPVLPEGADVDDFEEWHGQDANADRLDQAVGGDWWRRHASDRRDPVEQAGSIVRELADRLRSLCKEVCFYEVYGRWKHKVPKYFLVFATRSPVALALMNDAMFKGHDEFLDQSVADELPLWQSAGPAALRREPENLDAMILEAAQARIARPKLVQHTIERMSHEQGLGLVNTGGLKKRITDLRKQGRLDSDPPTGRMNDKTVVWSRK